LSDISIEGNLLLKVLNKNVLDNEYNNNMSVVLVDYFCRNLDDPEPEQDLEGAQFNSFCVQTLYPSF
jgi:hypothetical protein